MMSLSKIGKVMVLWNPDGGPTHSGTWVIGEVASFSEALDFQGSVVLREPLWIQRTAVQGKQTLEWTHNVVADAYWSFRRENTRPFNLNAFASFSVLDENDAKDMVQIKKYRDTLATLHVGEAGLIMPPNNNVTSLKR